MRQKQTSGVKRVQGGERATTVCNADVHVVCSKNRGDLACLQQSEQRRNREGHSVGYTHSSRLQNILTKILTILCLHFGGSCLSQGYS